MNNKEIKVKVNITGGTFKGLQGCIDEITEDIVKVEITMFGRRCTYNVPKEYCEYDPAELKAVEEEMEKARFEEIQDIVIYEIQGAWREVEDSIDEGLYIEKNITPAEAFQHMEKFRKELIENFSKECSEVGLDCSAIVGELKNAFAI